MKVLVLMGSPRKGNRFRACEEFREHLQKICPTEFEYAWLKDAHIDPCKGCMVCFSRGEEKCPSHDDDVHCIVQKMLAADGVIFASPVYSINVSGLMKNFIDRISYIGHRPRFFGKPAFFLVTAGIIGTDETLEYLKIITWAWGFECAGTAGLISQFGPVPRERAETNKKQLRDGAERFSLALLRTGPESPGLKRVLHFYGMRPTFTELEKISPADFRYWKDHGWLSPDVQYFMDVPLNPLYLAIGKMVEMLARRQVRKDLIQPADGPG
jgi:multimeric flavodoxin WrbA